MGDSGELAIRIRRPAGQMFTFVTGTHEEILLSPRFDGTDACVTIPNIRGWDVGTVFVSETA